ncbi:MAG: protease complex subunit PrcB family protein [Planctomycetes bacterium]|nr:protease complex subunit PrcB family protein [Planctomycetota bacterium]
MLHSKYPTRLAWVCMAMMGLAGCASTPTEEVRPQAQAVPIFRAAAGDEPGLTRPGVVYLNSRSKLGDLHAPEAEKLSVDFVKEAMIVVALGERPTGGYWVRITGVRRVGHVLIAQATCSRPGPGSAAAQVVTHPFAAAVIPAQSGPVEVSLESTSVEGE